MTINIKDSGKGMDRETLKHLFDPFYTTNRGAHSGLGMHVVYNRVVELLDGKISCKSQLGEGTEVRLMVPDIQRVIELNNLGADI